MSCLFPQSCDLVSFWQNIVQGKDCVREVAPEEWSQETFYQPYDEWRKNEHFEKIYCRRGGFITEEAEFNALKYGVMPNAVAATDPDQMLALRLACQALEDAGYGKRSFNADKAEVIMGRTSAPGHGSMNAIQYGATVEQIVKIIEQLRPDLNASALDLLAGELRRSLKPCVPEAIPGVMPNILAGRIAGKLGFRGKSLVLDSACASSLVAVEMAVTDLRSGLADLVLAGGSFVNSFAVFYQLFSRLGALSHSEQIKPFDQSADGTLLGEGVGMVVLKRMSDAIADGDRIYATILGVGSSSDGKGTSMLSPAVDGEALAMQRAYDDAGISPRTVALVEAHGTGTAVGDVAEVQALKKVFGAGARSDEDSKWCALGSIKSMIGHTQAASGIAGLIKAALSLYQRVLPPTLNVVRPNSQIDWQKSPCYINTKTRPWIHARPHPLLKAVDPLVKESLPPRRAAVSAFGFGGVNAHVVLEECEDPAEDEHPSLHQEWETEVFCFANSDQAALLKQLAAFRNYLGNNPDEKLKDLAYTINCAGKGRFTPVESEKEIEQGKKTKQVSVGLVVQSLADLKHKVEIAEQTLSSGKSIDHVRTAFELKGIYFSDHTDVAEGKLAFVLPGLGAAYPGMLAELCLHFPEVRMIFDFVDDLAAKSGSSDAPSQKIFPYPDLLGNGGGQTSATLATMDSAVVTVLMAEWAIFTLLFNLEIRPDILVGCSTGEFAALTMSGAADILALSPIFYHLSTTTARAVPQDRLAELRSVRVAAPYETVEPYLKRCSESVYLGADLSRHQILLSGYIDSVEDLLMEFDRDGIEADLLPAAIPYHTPLVEGVIDEDRQELLDLEMREPQIPSWSCSVASFYPAEPDALKKIATQLFTVPIQFRRSIESLYKEGVRKFVEVGPKGTLSVIVSEVLSDKPHLAVASNRASFSAISQLNHMLAALFTQGVSPNFEYLYKRREPKQIDFDKSKEATKRAGNELLKLSYPEVRLLDGWQERTGVSDHYSPSIEEGPGDEAVSIPGEEQVISSYLDTIASFHSHLMSVQEEVMASYLGNRPIIGSEDSNTIERRFPLMQGASFQATDDSLAIEIPLNLEEHRYLFDHAIGGIVRKIYRADERVYLLPLTVAIELMAEAASYYYPGLKISAVSDVRAYKRIRVGAEGTTIEIIARKVNDASRTVSAEICRRRGQGGQQDSSEQDRELLMTCQITFALELNRLHRSPEAGNTGGRAPYLTPESLYGSKAMFHGPRMQSVISLTSVGERDISGRVSTRAPVDWFGDMPEPNDQGVDFLLNPLLLDNATQLVLFHLFERAEEADALLPFIVESIHFYTDLASVPEVLKVRAVLDSITQRNTNADVHLFDEDGRLIAEFRSISSRRIVLDERWRSFVTNPDSTYLSNQHSLDLSQYFGSKMITCRGANEAILPQDEGTLSWCADYLLSPWETQTFESLSPANRRREWLLGRIVAKDAVRELALKISGNQLCAADIEIYSDGYGKPFIAEFYSGDTDLSMHISITHKNGTAIAIASEAMDSVGIGVDLEVANTREQGFEDLVLNEDERKRFATALSGNRDLVLTKIWSAKEAASKALGNGLSGNPKSLEIVKANNRLDEFEVVASVPKLALAGEHYRKEARPQTVRVAGLRFNEFVLTIAVGR
jgi:acyl transferase domain-containing protein/phosphopantetheinyl transferase (holo-ACP synthase)